jgi:hypothetical protein
LSFNVHHQFVFVLLHLRLVNLIFSTGIACVCFARSD